MPWISTTDAGCVLNIKAVPRAARTELRGVENDRLCVRLHAPPNDGKANAALRGLLSAALRVPERDILLISGAASRHKRVLLRGVPAAAAAAALGEKKGVAKRKVEIRRGKRHTVRPIEKHHVPH